MIVVDPDPVSRRMQSNGTDLNETANATTPAATTANATTATTVPTLLVLAGREVRTLISYICASQNHNSQRTRVQPPGTQHSGTVASSRSSGSSRRSAVRFTAIHRYRVLGVQFFVRYEEMRENGSTRSFTSVCASDGY